MSLERGQPVRANAIASQFGVGSVNVQAAFVSPQSQTPSAKAAHTKQSESLNTVAQEHSVTDGQSQSTSTEKVRWAKEAFPLSLYVEGLTSDHPVADEFETLVLDSIAEWERASGQAIQIKIADSQDRADIEILWSDTPIEGREHEVGHAKRTVNTDMVHSGYSGYGGLSGSRHIEGVITHADITLITKPVIDGELTPAQQRRRLHATILHELGHALGLNHSPAPWDAMYYQGWRNTHLSNGDIMTLRGLYL